MFMNLFCKIVRTAQKRAVRFYAGILKIFLCIFPFG